MSSRTPQPDNLATGPATETIDAQRREPFGKSPAVGARGKATQQRLLAAALELFDEPGYHQTSVEAITERAGCSRPTLYQYFESKADLFRRLAGRYGESLADLVDNLEPIDATPAGVAVMGGWFLELLGLHDDYRPIARSFSESLQRDAEMVKGAGLLADRYGRALARALTDPLSSEVDLEPLASLLMVTAFGTINHGTRNGADFDRGRLATGIAGAVHRALFGKLDGVNTFRPVVHPRSSPSGRRLHSAPPVDRGLRPKGERTRSLLLSSAAAVFAERGYHNTRVDDIVAAASLSHGAFYRYFDDKAAIFCELALAAAADMVALLDELPDPQDGLEPWCRRYYSTYQDHGPLFSMWPEATEAGVQAGPDVEQVVMATLEGILAARSFGDLDVDSLVLFALVESGPQATMAFGALSADDAVRSTALVLSRALLD